MPQVNAIATRTLSVSGRDPDSGEFKIWEVDKSTGEKRLIEQVQRARRVFPTVNKKQPATKQTAQA